MGTLDGALRQFEATEANLEKLEKLWDQIFQKLPTGPAFGSPPEYDELCLAFRRILPALPAIDGFRIADCLHDYDAVGQMRLDALEVGDFEIQVSTENTIEEQGRWLKDYRFKLRAKRRDLVRQRVLALIDSIEQFLAALKTGIGDKQSNEYVNHPDWIALKDSVSEVDTLLGSDERPPRWDLLRRHLYFGMFGDLVDIIERDWPAVKQGLQSNLYGEHDPVPVGVEDLSETVASRPQGPVTSKLAWTVLSDEDFERMMFVLICDTSGYENPEWLQQTRSPDRGRDLSVIRLDNDPLGGVRRYRVIIQCKHWLSKSVGAAEVSAIRAQMELWQPPRVDELILATTGRFTADAIALVEQHNQADRALHISMWPESHLERLLAQRPHLIAQFRLR